MSTEIDYYELLECERTADDATIKTSYRKLAMKYHPDKNSGCKDSEAKFKAVSQAYDVLKDPQKRAAYDRFGHAAFQNGGGGSGAQDFGAFSDIFENIFGEFMGGRGGGRPQQRRGADLRYDMEITLEEAFHGKATDVTVDVTTTCDSCSGSGARAGTKEHVCGMCKGGGKVRAQQGFFVVERTCPTCHGSGQIITDPCPACRGEGRVEKTKTLSVNIPAGVDEGTRIRLSGEGEAGARGAAPGDLYIFLHVKRHAIFEREGTTLYRARAGQLHQRRARWRDRDSGAGWRSPPHPHSGRHSVGQGTASARRGHAGAAGPWPRRPGDPYRGRDPDQIVGQAKGIAGSVPRDRDRRRMPRKPRLLRENSVGVGVETDVRPPRGSRGRAGLPSCLA